MSLSLDQSLRAPMWDPTFWSALEGAENKAKKALIDLWEDGTEGDRCVCETCIVKVVLEAVWPTLTEQIIRIYSDVETIGSCGKPCNGNCKKGCNAPA